MRHKSRATDHTEIDEGRLIRFPQGCVSYEGEIAVTCTPSSSPRRVIASCRISARAPWLLPREKTRPVAFDDASP